MSQFREELWGPSILFPGYYAFVPDEAQWRFECERLAKECKHPEFATQPYPDAKGHCWVIHAAGPPICLVTIHESADGRWRMDPAAVAGVFAHEAMHVWRYIREYAGEDEPSAELEGYAIQAITEHLLTTYIKTRIEPRKRKRKAKPPAAAA